jgi:uncharacterized membrane protein HdeD (DUF308 family)
LLPVAEVPAVGLVVVVVGVAEVPAVIEPRQDLQLLLEQILQLLLVPAEMVADKLTAHMALMVVTLYLALLLLLGVEAVPIVIMVQLEVPEVAPEVVAVYCLGA